jgi:hypothetical protein
MIADRRNEKAPPFRCAIQAMMTAAATSDPQRSANLAENVPDCPALETPGARSHSPRVRDRPTITLLAHCLGGLQSPSVF